MKVFGAWVTVAAIMFLALPVGSLPAQVRADSQELTPATPLTRIDGERVTLFYTDGDSAQAAAYKTLLLEQPPLPGLPDSVPSVVSVYVVSSNALFDQLLEGRAPEWSAGVAIPSRGIMVIPVHRSGRGRSGEVARVLRHEWAHLALGEHVQGLRPPRWFDEGYAQWVSGWNAAEAWRLRLAIAQGRTPPLDSLTLSWPRGRAEAEAAYLMSATVLEYLVQQSGMRGLELFLSRWPELGSFESALRATYGITSVQLEESWKSWVKRRYGWLYVLSQSVIVWLLLGILLLFMVRIRVRYRVERMAKLRAVDPPEAPVFWRDPPEDAEDP